MRIDRVCGHGKRQDADYKVRFEGRNERLRELGVAWPKQYAVYYACTMNMMCAAFPELTPGGVERCFAVDRKDGIIRELRLGRRERKALVDGSGEFF